VSDRVLVELTVNGKPRAVAVKPNATLKQLVRDELDLTGTKGGCEAGDCGACTVLMDGRAVTSCLVLAVEAQGATITTIEGLGENGELHPLQKSFIKHGALQCGFCTPGMIMAAKALIDRNPDPSREEVLEAPASTTSRAAAMRSSAAGSRATTRRTRCPAACSTRPTCACRT
jgi:carbon-monoxide dehydrogenase small subunit